MTFKGSGLFLGTGSSAGIPVVACRCEVCRSHNSKNKRLRPSILLQLEDKFFVIDPGPDFRQQALMYHIDHLDGAIISHIHYDHSAGLDELRSYYFVSGEPMPCLVSKPTMDDLKVRYHYLMEPPLEGGSLSARVEFQILQADRGKTTFQGAKVQYFTYSQADTSVNGFRFGDFAYVTDIRSYPDTLFQDLQGVHTLILSALRYTPSHLHFSVDQAIDFAHRVQAKRTFLTHIAHEIEHERCSSYLPEDIVLAYDGLSFDL